MRLMHGCWFTFELYCNATWVYMHRINREDALDHLSATPFILLFLFRGETMFVILIPALVLVSRGFDWVREAAFSR